MFEGRAEEFSLTSRRNAGNNDDHSGMQRFLSVKSKKIGAIVGYKRVLLSADCGYQLPVLRACALFFAVVKIRGTPMHAEPHFPTSCHYQVFSNLFVFKNKIEKEGLPSDSPAGLRAGGPRFKSGRPDH